MGRCTTRTPTMDIRTLDVLNIAMKPLLQSSSLDVAILEVLVDTALWDFLSCARQHRSRSRPRCLARKQGQEAWEGDGERAGGVSTLLFCTGREVAGGCRWTWASQQMQELGASVGACCCGGGGA